MGKAARNETVRRYRKTGTILAQQIPVGHSVLVHTLEGRAIGRGPDWRVRANTERGEQWVIPNGFFAGPFGYDPTGEVIDGLAVYRKKPTADVLAYQVLRDDHEPVPMPGLDEPFVPPPGYYVVMQLDGSFRRAVIATEFEGDRPTYVAVDGAV